MICNNNIQSVYHIIYDFKSLMTNSIIIATNYKFIMTRDIINAS